MKSFFEEYGMIIVALVAVFVLIALTTPVGDAIKNAILGAVDSLTNVTHVTPAEEQESTTAMINVFTNKFFV